MARRQGKGSPTEELFEKDEELAVDFEIALAAFLATGVLTYSQVILPVVSQIAAFGVLGTTLGRRVAQVSTNANTDWIQKNSTPILELFTVISILLLLMSGAFSLQESIGVISSELWFSLGTMLLYTSLVLIEEKLFADYALWWHAKFEEKANSSNSIFFIIMKMLTARISYWLGSRSKSEMFQTGMSTSLSEPLEDLEYWEIIKSVSKWFFWFLISIIPFVIFGFSQLSVSGIVVIVPILMARDHTRFWFLAYGNTTFERLTDSLSRSYITVSIYLLVVLFNYTNGEFSSPIPLLL